MEYVDFYFKNIQAFIIPKNEIKCFVLDPYTFAYQWFKSGIKPPIDFNSFDKEVKGLFSGNVEELYILCFYVYTLINESYFFLLRPTPKNVNDELDKMDNITSITFTDKAGKSFSVKTTTIINKVIEIIRNDNNDTEYETEEGEPSKVCDVSNNLYIQSNFVMELANFLNLYFPQKRKKDTLASTAEQKLILTILWLFKLSTALLSDSRFRQLKMSYSKLKLNPNLSLLPFGENGEMVYAPLSYIKWNQWKDGKIDWESTTLEGLQVGETVNIIGGQ